MSDGEVPTSFYEVVNDLDRAAYASQDFHEIEQGFRRSERELEYADQATRDAILALTAAFQYLLRHGRTSKGASPFVPMFEFDDRQIPPRPTDVPESWGQAWSDGLSLAEHPAVRARLADLMFSGRIGDAGSHARIATESYLDLTQLESWSSIDKEHGLERAYELTTLTKDAEARSRVLNATERAARQELSMGAPPGVVVNAVERLLGDDSFRLVGLELIDEALTLYSDSPHLVDDILSIKRGHVAPDMQVQIDRQRAENWLIAAETAAGADKLFFLERAAQLASRGGLVDLREVAVREIQGLDRDDLGLARYQHSVDLPTDAVEEYLAQFVAASTWRGALLTVAAHAPLTGDYEENLESLEQLRKEAPISFLLRRVKLGGDGLPRWQPSTEEQEQDDRLTQHEVLRFQIAAPLYAEGLTRIGGNYNVETTELEGFFSEWPGFDVGAARVLANGLRLYWAGDYNSSAHVVIWQIEATARRILLQADRPVYTVQRKNNPGQYVSLSMLLKELARLGLDYSWYRYLWSVFASPAGAGLRNEIAHGFAGELGPAEAAAILHAVSYLGLLKTVE